MSQNKGQLLQGPVTVKGDLIVTGNINKGSQQVLSNVASAMGLIASDASNASFKQTIYIRSWTMPATPTGVNPTGWSTAVPTGGGRLYASTINGNPANNLLMSETTYMSETLYMLGYVWSPPFQVNENAAIAAPAYLGKFLSSDPTNSNSGDFWLVYGTSDSPIQRGVWQNQNGAIVRVSDDVATNAPLIAAAMSDILGVVATGLYGTITAYGTITYIANLGANVAFIAALFATLITVTNALQSAGAVGSGSYVPAADQGQPYIYMDFQNKLLTLRDDKPNGNNAFRKMQLGPSVGMVATLYDSSGLNPVNIHDLPNAPAAAGLRNMGHLYYLTKSSIIHLLNVQLTDVSTSYTLNPGVVNTNIASYLPTGITNVKGVYGIVYLQYSVDPTKVGASTSALVVVSSSDGYNGAGDTKVIGEKGLDYAPVASGKFWWENTCNVVIPVNYSSGVPYISTSIYFDLENMLAVSALYSGSISFYIQGIYV